MKNYNEMENMMDEIEYFAEGGKSVRSKNSYCGFRKVPKGKHLGSLVECLEKGEIRLWGREDYLKFRLIKLGKMLEMYVEDLKKAHPGKEFQIMMRHKYKLEDEISKARNDLINTKKHLDATKRKIEQDIRNFKPKNKN